MFLFYYITVRYLGYEFLLDWWNVPYSRVSSDELILFSCTSTLYVYHGNTMWKVGLLSLALILTCYIYMIG